LLRGDDDEPNTPIAITKASMMTGTEIISNILMLRYLIAEGGSASMAEAVTNKCDAAMLKDTITLGYHG
jgi:hypothetical protein